jgi:hypothetical protein
MRIQDRTLRRSQTPMTGVALAMACAAGALIFLEWVPALAFSPYAIVTRMAFAADLPDPANAKPEVPLVGQGKARCPVCNMRRPGRTGGKRGNASRAEECADRVNPVVAASQGNAGAQQADLALLLDWHLNASRGYDVGTDAISCSAQSASAAPIPVAVSEAYEMATHLRDGTAPGPATNWRSGDNPGARAAFRKAAD